jgi:hypothetical protein
MSIPSRTPPSEHVAAGRTSAQGTRFSRAQRMTIVNGILLIVILIVVLQLWLLTASMNAMLGGDHGVAVPAAVASLVCLGLNAGLLWYLYRLDE